MVTVVESQFRATDQMRATPLSSSPNCQIPHTCCQ